MVGDWTLKAENIATDQEGHGFELGPVHTRHIEC